MLQPEMRVCKRCGMEKPITNYNKKGENKWRTTCKQCDAIVRKMRRISEKRLTNQNNTESRGDDALLEMSGDRESLLANLRVLLPDEGRVTVEW